MSRRYDFKNGLIEAIKASGQTLIENAEDIAGKTEFMTDLSITIGFGQDEGCLPLITITRSHRPNSEKLNRILDTYYPGEATDDE